MKPLWFVLPSWWPILCRPWANRPSRDFFICGYRPYSKYVNDISKYINDMPLFIKRINTMLYADDATISASGKRIVDIENTLSDFGTSASNWCLKNDMILSLPKCNTLMISSKKTALNSQCRYRWYHNTKMSTTKILGVYFDNVMCWDEHIKGIRNKITKKLYLLQQIKLFLPVNTGECQDIICKQLYFATYWLLLSYMGKFFNNTSNFSRKTPKKICLINSWWSTW